MTVPPPERRQYCCHVLIGDPHAETCPRKTPASTLDPVTRYGFRRTPAGRVECADCLQTFPPEGAVMRSHARHCPINPRSFPIPGVCDA